MDFSTQKIVEGLNERQHEAVTFGEGPMLVVAGAGTGKTMVITRRIAYLIASKMAEPEEILALTFTDKAAAEMEERVDLLLPYGFANVEISTFHAFGDKLLREYSLDLGLTSDLKVLSQPDQYIFFREHLFDFPLQYYRPLNDPTQFIQAILSLISRAKDEDISPQEYLDYANSLQGKEGFDLFDKALQDEALKQVELAHTYKTYQEYLIKEGKIDFGDQVILVLKLFRQHPSILERIRKQYRYILVDEFQDTNYSQFRMLQYLAGGMHRNINVVGDDDQSIYKFRGAAISNILNFTENYPDAKKIVLIDNYRSSQAILDSAYRLIQHNNPDRLEVKINVDKQLRANCEYSPLVKHLHYDTLMTQADEVAKLISQRKEENNYQYRDFAILVRTNNDANPFLRSLNVLDIPYRFSGNKGLYQQPEIQLLLSFLRVIADFEDSVSLFHLASCEIYMLKMADLLRCSNIAKRKNVTLFSVFENLNQYENSDKLSSESKATIKKLMQDIAVFLKLSREKTVGVVLYEFLEQTKYLRKLAQTSHSTNDLKVQNIARFFDIVRNFGLVTQLDRVQNFVKYLDMLVEAGDNPATAEADLDADAVQVLTVHKAKGLEFPVVFMVNLVQNHFPHVRRPEQLTLPQELLKERLQGADSHKQEERRLFYVAMTRAQRELYFTSARDFGTVRPRKISQFVMEALDKRLADKDYLHTSALQQIARHAPAPEKSVDHFAPIPDDETITLSFYQIDDYLTCPLKYKYVHVLRVPILPHHTVIYGKALHEAVSEYLRRKMRDLPVTLKDLIHVFEDSWMSEGFISREHEEMRLQAGRNALERFFTEHEQDSQLPQYIEKEFSFIWKNNRLVGRWDRVDQSPAGTEIIDYKSSSVQDQDKADNRAKESLQLAIYALAYNETYQEYPKQVKLYFLESGLIGGKEVDQKMILKAKEKIKQSAKGIRKRIYEPTPGYFVCRYCAYSNICPVAMV